MDNTTEEIMLQINDTLVTLDLAERFFQCDLGKCLGECCIEGDAGAPITEEEYEELKKTQGCRVGRSAAGSTPAY